VLQELARQVRGRTLDLVQAAPEPALLWAPPGTQNHILWHAGHAVWLMDVLGLELLVGRSQLPRGWEEIFGMNCQPPRLTRTWPSRQEVVRLLQEQLERYLAALERTPAESLALPTAAAARRSLAGRLLHGLHDEACHSGEMYLLLKLFTRTQRPGSRS
jgi:hypothetical protein